MNQVINKRTNKEQMLGIFKVGFLLRIAGSFILQKSLNIIIFSLFHSFTAILTSQTHVSGRKKENVILKSYKY